MRGRVSASLRLCYLLPASRPRSGGDALCYLATWQLTVTAAFELAQTRSHCQLHIAMKGARHRTRLHSLLRNLLKLRVIDS